MDAAFDQLRDLLDLDARHDDLLRQLDELEQQIEAVLAEYQTGGEKEAVEKSTIPLPEGERKAA